MNLTRIGMMSAVLLCATWAFAEPARGASAFDGQCIEQRLSVSLAPGAPADASVVGALCWRGALAGKTVQLLVHGATYNRSYWDFPYQQPLYSYVEAAALSGYATFNLDRIGAGASDRPPSAAVTVDSNAWVIHQVVQALRSGAVQSEHFRKVILVGHSFGSTMVVAAASQFPGDANGVILSGFLHNQNPAAQAPASIWPVQLDPQFAGQPYPLGYLTTRPGTRAAIFYSLQTADPNAIALDEQTKDTVTDATLAGAPRNLSLESLGIRVPVLVVVGELDDIFCGGLVNCSDSAAVHTHESRYFSPEACLQTAVIPQTGHVLALHSTAPLTSAHALLWSERYVGSDQAPRGCLP